MRMFSNVLTLIATLIAYSNQVNGSYTCNTCDLNDTVVVLGTITCDSSISGEMNGVGVQYYSVDFTSSNWNASYNTAIFDACDSDYDNYLWFYNEDGEYVDHRDDYCGLQSRLEVNNLVEGTYLLGVGAWPSKAASAHGNFTIDVYCGNEDVPSTTDYSSPYTTSYYNSRYSDIDPDQITVEEQITCGETIVGFVQNGSEVYYEFLFSGSNYEEDVYFDTCQSGTDFDSDIYIYNSNGSYQLYHDGASSCSWRAQLHLQNLDEGDYYLKIKSYYSYGSSSGGSFEMEVTCGDDININNNSDCIPDYQIEQLFGDYIQLDCMDEETVEINGTYQWDTFKLYYDSAVDTVITSNCGDNDEVYMTVPVFYDDGGCLIDYQVVYNDCNQYEFNSSSWSSGYYYVRMYGGIGNDTDSADSYTVRYQCVTTDDDGTTITTEPPSTDSANGKDGIVVVVAVLALILSIIY